MNIAKAWWSTNSEIIVALDRDCPFIPKAELLDSDIKVVSVERSDKRRYARYSSYYIEGGDVHFFVSPRVFANAERDKTYYLCADFNGWGKAIGNARWRMRPVSGDANFYCELAMPFSALKLRGGVGEFKFADENGEWLQPSGDALNLVSNGIGNANLKLNPELTGAHAFVLKTSLPCQLGEPDVVHLPDFDLTTVADESFLLAKIYSSAKLGVYLVDGATEFSIFAPRASAVYVVYTIPGEKNSHIMQAVTRDSAVWKARAESDLRGCFYSFHVDGENKSRSTAFNRSTRVADPYANAVPDPFGRAIVKYDFQLPVADNSFKPPHWHDLVIVEAHLRDILANAPAALDADGRLGFGGLTKWLRSPDCYLRRCGANCVELQPVQEFTYSDKRDYEWGYMPVNWSAPSSAYASDPARGSQNGELAELVKAFHDAGLAVILDVVYNHYGEPNFLALIDKQYYFVSDADGNLSNCSGCGNDFRAYTPMGRRLILDTLKKFLRHYGVDGFRFDLAELLGTDVLSEIERELKKIKPSVILIAEPWSFRGHIARRLKHTGFASWNDGFREFILQYAKGAGNFEGFKYFMKGSMGGVASFPAQSVNYVESHDDMCLFDRISRNYDNPSAADIRRYKLAYALTLTAHGIPMVAEGFDLLRTKRGKNNTYKDGDTNKLDYFRGARFSGVCDWLRRFARFRLSPMGAALRPDGFPGDDFFEFYRSVSGAGAGAVMFNRGGADASCAPVFAAFNPLLSDVEFVVGKDLRGFRFVADIDNFCESGLMYDAFIQGGVLKLPPLSMVLMVGGAD